MKIKLKAKKIFFLIIAITLITSLSVGIRMFIKTNNTINTKENYRAVNDANQEYQKLNVLVINIDPILYSITNTSLYPNNNGHPRVSEYFRQNNDVVIAELKEDFEYISNDYFDVQIVKEEWLNEFPQYTENIELSNGTSANRFDETTYLEKAASEYEDYGTWYTLWSNTHSMIDEYGKFDYNYLINKYNLIQRKNNGEFDMVWINSIYPASTFETIMVGQNPYYINGTSITKNCDNFIISGIYTGRRDSNLHRFSHSIEYIMERTFGQSFDRYATNAVDVTTDQGWQNLNLWERFILNRINAVGEKTGVGNVHLPFNGDSNNVNGNGWAYDYTNEDNVYSNWKDWEDNYPNLTNEMTLSNSSAWLEHPDNLALASDENKDPDRLYIRFWGNLMPHISGRYSDGHLNNWWKYIYSLDYITSVTEKGNTVKTVNAGEDIRVNLDLEYYSGDVENLSKIPEGDNIHIQNTDVVSFRNGVLYAKNQGQTDVEVFFDGKSTTYDIRVNGTYKTFTATFDQNTASAIGSNSLSCSTYGTTCTITLPSITAEDNEEVVGWAKYSDGSGDIYNPGDNFELSGNTTLFAITNSTNRVTSVTLDKNEMTIYVDEEFTLQETVLPPTADNKNVTWSSSNPEIATVNDGVVTGVGEGTAVITVTTEDGEKTSNCVVIVEAQEEDDEIRINEIHLIPNRADIEVGETIELEAEIIPADATNKSLVWESDNENVATVLNGVVKGLRSGTATIRAYSYDRNIVGMSSISVSEPVQSESQSETQSESRNESQSESQSQSQSKHESQSESNSQRESKESTIDKDEDICMPYITYSKSSETSEPVIAVLNVKNKTCTVITETYEFKENGEYEFKYIDVSGKEKTIVAKVDWIVHDKSDTVKNPPTGFKDVALIAIPLMILAAGGYVYIKRKNILFRKI